MAISKLNRILICAVMSFLISPIPSVAFAVSVDSVAPKQGMISTNIVLNELSRAEAEQEVRSYLQTSEVKTELLKRGLSADEITARLAALSEQEIRDLSGQVQQARAGGDILITILVVVLIIFIIKRI